MGRTTPQALNALRHARGLEEAHQRIEALEARITELKGIIREICDLHNLPHADLRYAHYVPVQVTEQLCGEEDEEEVDGGCTALCDSLIGEMITNLSRKRRRYTETTKKFYCTIYLRSSAAYKALRGVLPLPSPKTLKRQMQEPIATLSSRIESMHGAHDVLFSYREKYQTITWPIAAVIAVDACSHADYFRETEDNSLAIAVGLDEFLARFNTGVPLEPVQVPSCNYCFVYYLQPIHPSLPCVPLFLSTERSGKATIKQSQTLEQLTQIAKKLGFKIVMKCADGGNEYYGDVRDSYASIRSICHSFHDVELIARLGHEILAGVTHFGADMLHILKNGRTRLLTNSVSVNVRWPRRVNLWAIRQAIDIPDACFTDRFLHKMVDSFPICMFTFKNSLQLLDHALVSESMYFLLFALFQGFFRVDCSYVTRIGIGVQCIRCAQRYIDYVQWATKQRTCFCSEVRRFGSLITMFTETHLQRMIVTVTVILALMLVGPEDASMALNRCSTHPLENFFGLTRIACRFKHTYPNIRDAAARAQFIRDVHHELNLPISINKRLNIAGQKIVIQKQGHTYIDVDMSLGFMCLIDYDYARSQLGITEPLEAVTKTVREFLLMLSLLSLPEAHIPGKYSGQQILTRLIANP